MIAAPLIKGLEDAALNLQDALAKHAGAVALVAEAKRTLEVNRAKRLVAGIDGKNEAAREAALQLDLYNLYEDAHEAEQALIEARCELDRARLDWDLARYTVRALEVS